MNFSRLLILNNNLILDKENNVQIPQNDRSFFTFNQEFLNNSREVGINPHEVINILNLFITVKSFINSVQYPPHSILLAVRDELSFIAHNIDISNLKKISYLGFTTWLTKQLEKDATYLKRTSTYSFIFTYPIEIFDRNDLKFLKPKYPWNSEILKPLSIQIDESNSYLTLIENQQQEIIKLKKIVSSLRNKKK